MNFELRETTVIIKTPALDLEAGTMVDDMPQATKVATERVKKRCQVTGCSIGRVIGVDFIGMRCASKSPDCKLGRTSPIDIKTRFSKIAHGLQKAALNRRGEN